MAVLKIANIILRSMRKGELAMAIISSPPLPPNPTSQHFQLHKHVVLHPCLWILSLFILPFSPILTSHYHLLQSHVDLCPCLQILRSFFPLPSPPLLLPLLSPTSILTFPLSSLLRLPRGQKASLDSSFVFFLFVPRLHFAFPPYLF